MKCSAVQRRVRSGKEYVFAVRVGHVELEIIYTRHVSTRCLLQERTLTGNLLWHMTLITCVYEVKKRRDLGEFAEVKPKGSRLRRRELYCGYAGRESLQAGENLDDDVVPASFNCGKFSCDPLAHSSTESLPCLCAS